MKITLHPSPNYDARGDVPLDMLILHYTGMPTAEEALARLCNENSKVSAHYFIDEGGQVRQLVDDSKRAWHAGVASWRGYDNINARSLGIEIVNPGHEGGLPDFPEAQIMSVITLCQELVTAYGIEPRNVVGHSDVAPARKQDPGEKFPWERLAASQVGLWPHAVDTSLKTPLLNQGDHGAAVQQLQQDLRTYGYRITIDGEYEAQTRLVVSAFQRHFFPKRVDGNWFAACQSQLESLLAMI